MLVNFKQCYCYISLLLLFISPQGLAFVVKDLDHLTAQTITVRGGQIEYYRFGSGSPILLIAGYLTDISSWNKIFLATLANQHQVIIFNNRNVGRSFMPEAQYGITDLANDTKALIYALHLQKPAVLGVSMGGMIAQQLALAQQDLLGQLILVNTMSTGEQAVLPSDAILRKMRDIPRHKFARFIAAINLFFPVKWRFKMAYTLLTDRFFPKDYQEINIEHIIAGQQHAMMNWVQRYKLASGLAHLHLPVLIVSGQVDSVIPPENSQILAHLLPHAKLIRIEEGGHGVLYQYPDVLAQAINQFIVENS